MTVLRMISIAGLLTLMVIAIIFATMLITGPIGVAASVIGLGLLGLPLMFGILITFYRADSLPAEIEGLQRSLNDIKKSSPFLEPDPIEIARVC